MKKKFLFIFLAFGLVSCGTSSSSLERPSTKSSEFSSSFDSSSISSSQEEDYQLILPQNVEGVTIEVNNSNPQAGDSVILYVSNDINHRINQLTMNETILEAEDTNQKNTKIYRFVMPANKNAVVEIEAVEVYLVSVAPNLQNKLSLAGIGDGYFAEGDSVTFTPTTYAGYYYKDIVSMNSSVTLIENDNSSFTFTMPSEMVVISAVIDKNVYLVTHNEDDENYSLSISNNYPAEYDSVVSFVVDLTSSDFEVSNVSVDGRTLNASSTGAYSFRMPAYPVEIEVDYVKVYKQISVENSDHYVATLKTIVSDEEVEVTNSNVLSNQKVYIDINNASNEEHDKVIDSINIYGGHSQDLINEDLGLASEEEGRRYFITSEDYRYYRVVVSEKIAPVEFIASFEGYTLSNSYYSHTLDFNEGGTIARDDTSATIDQTSPYYIYEVDNWGYMYRYFGFLSPNKDVFLEFNDGYAYDGNYTQSAKNSYNYSLSIFVDSAKLSENIFSVIACDEPTYPSEYYGEFVSITLADDSIINCYFDYSTMTPYWNVTYSVNGTDGKTEGDVLAVTASDGTPLASMTLSSKAVNGFQYRAKLN